MSNSLTLVFGTLLLMIFNTSLAQRSALPSEGERTLVGDATPMIDGSGYLSEALGIETQNGSFSTVLLSGCAVPCSAAFGFTTSKDNQETVTIRLFRGKSNNVADDLHLGNFEVGSIPRSPAGKVLIDITFSVDEAKRVSR